MYCVVLDRADRLRYNTAVPLSVAVSTREQPMRSLTIREVAKAAGVSVSTVSRILNGKPDVSVETRTKVLSAIQALNFVPHTQARRLASGRSRTIALLFPLQFVETAPHAGEFIVAAAAAAEAEGFAFQVMTTEIPVERLPLLYQSGQADGLILMQIALDDPRVRFLSERGFQFVMIGRTRDEETLPFVDLDFERCVLEAYAHLVSLGHYRIGFLGAPTELRMHGLGSAVRSFNGYQQACVRFNLDSPALEVDFSARAMYEATLSLLRDNPDLTAIVSTHGPSIVGTLRALRDVGRPVPQACSVVSIATAATAELLIPAPTSVEMPAAEMAQTAVRLLIAQLEGQENVQRHMLFPPKLVLRETTAEVVR